MSDKKIRVRFAPSPTGPLHIGGVRTALFNYLFAKKHNGDFILRIEDTDQTRFVPGAEEYIVESLNWCKIYFNEGINAGGEYGPYRQSERKHLYRQYAEQLLREGHAYYAFDTPEELEKKRKESEDRGKTFIYNMVNRGEMINSLSIDEQELTGRLQSGAPYVIRIRIPENEQLILHDIIRGEVVVNTSTLDDKILFKSDGMPTYHIANVVDDYLMKISHVIRGEEWLPSTPLHVLLYRYLDWENKTPQFAHIPLTLKPDGKGKLSKRDGDRLGFPVFPLEWTDPKTNEIYKGFREEGYLPEAFVNILVFLGWNPGTTKEIFSMEELIDEFSLERVGKAGSKFDPEKAKWFNHYYLVSKNNEELASLFQPLLRKKGIDADDDYVARVCGLIKERANFVSDLWEQSHFFFMAPTSFDPKVIKKKWKENTPDILNEIKDVLTKTQAFDAHFLENTIKKYLEKKGLGLGQVMNALRLTMVGANMGPGLFEIMELLGKNEVIKRIETGLLNIKRK